MRLPSPRGSAVGDSPTFRAAKLLRMGPGRRAVWARSSASGDLPRLACQWRPVPKGKAERAGADKEAPSRRVRKAMHGAGR